MSTTTTTPPLSPTREPIGDPMDAVARTRPRPTVQDTISQTLTMAWRSTRIS